MDFIAALQKAMTSFLPIVIAITLHEAAHGYAAMKLGDRTAYEQGRVTFNPIKHIDLFGTILIPVVLFISQAPFLIGYAKPVPVNASRLRNPKSGMAIVAAAGPGMNLALFILSALGFKILLVFGCNPDGFPSRLLLSLMFMNLFIGLFNLLPILPLDGGRIIASALPRKWERMFSKHEPYGMYIVLGLVLLLPWVLKMNPVGYMLTYVSHVLAAGVFSVFGIS
jgi:Zn-dependent protease